MNPPLSNGLGQCCDKCPRAAAPQAPPDRHTIENAIAASSNLPGRLNGSAQMAKHHERIRSPGGCHWRLARQCFSSGDGARPDKLPVAPAFPFVRSYSVRRPLPLAGHPRRRGKMLPGRLPSHPAVSPLIRTNARSGPLAWVSYTLRNGPPRATAPPCPAVVAGC
jgi:hypothetical protein